MTGLQMTLLGIFAFIVLILGSFIWFISTWDASKQEPVVLVVPQSEPKERRV